MSKARQKQRAAARRKSPSNELSGWQEFIVKLPGIRKRIECAIPARMLLNVVLHMSVSERSTEVERSFADTLIPAFASALEEPFGGLCSRRVQECLSATKEACLFACGIGNPGHGITPPVMIMATIDWLSLVERGGYLIGQDGSDFDAAKAVLVNELEAGRRSEKVSALYRESAEKAAALVPLMQIRFEEVGLFVGALDYLLSAAQPVKEAA